MLVPLQIRQSVGDSRNASSAPHLVRAAPGPRSLCLASAFRKCVPGSKPDVALFSVETSGWSSELPESSCVLRGSLRTSTDEEGGPRGHLESGSGCPVGVHMAPDFVLLERGAGGLGDGVGVQVSASRHCAVGPLFATGSRALESLSLWPLPTACGLLEGRPLGTLTLWTFQPDCRGGGFRNAFRWQCMPPGVAKTSPCHFIRSII